MIGRDWAGGNGEVKTWKLGKKAEKFLARGSETGESRLPPTPPLANARSTSVAVGPAQKKRGPPRHKLGETAEFGGCTNRTEPYSMA